MHVFRTQIDLAKEVLLHEGMITQGILVVDAYIFVKVERADPVKVDHAAFVPLHEHLVSRNRGGARRQAKHAVSLAGDLRRKEHTGGLAGSPCAFVDVEFHTMPSSMIYFVFLMFFSDVLSILFIITQFPRDAQGTRRVFPVFA